MKHIAITFKDIKVVPDWALQNKQYVKDADFETAVYANLGMPVEPEYYAEHHIGGVTELIAWRGKYITAVKAVMQ
jgi:hypothetical protein